MITLKRKLNKALNSYGEFSANYLEELCEEALEGIELLEDRVKELEGKLFNSLSYIFDHIGINDNGSFYLPLGKITELDKQLSLERLFDKVKEPKQ